MLVWIVAAAATLVADSMLLAYINKWDQFAAAILSWFIGIIWTFPVARLGWLDSQVTFLAFVFAVAAANFGVVYFIGLAMRRWRRRSAEG